MKDLSRGPGRSALKDEQEEAGNMVRFGTLSVVMATATLALAGDALTAMAQDGGAAARPNPWLGNIFVFGSLMLIFYFLILRPQQRRQKDMQKMIESLKKGDKVLTNGGVYGVVSAIKEDRIVLEVSKDVRMEFAKSAVASVDA